MFFAWIIFGPTASGKSARSLALAKEKGANILSFDSRQLYRQMTIGTGQDIPPGYVQDSDNVFRIPSNPSAPALFGLSVAEPNEPFSIKRFFEFAQPIIESHRQANQPLVLVGGSWPYAQVLIDPPESLFSEQNAQLRTELASLALSELQTRLQTLSPNKWDTLNESDRQNPRRLIRALEVAQVKEALPPNPCLEANEYAVLLQTLPFEQIEANIQTRIESRLDQRVLDETRQLVQLFPDWSTPAFSATGYRFLRRHLEGEIELDTARQLWYFQERQYAKRQLTWLKKIEREKRYNIAA